ncbi:MAG: hypothetical protein AAF355_04845 [Myxococcota bacterium]
MVTDVRRQWCTVFGWVLGACLGLYLSFGFYLFFEINRATATALTFAFLVGGAFGGMALADRLGNRGFPWLAASAGTALAIGFVFLAILGQ